jgi:hypothetical protein
MVIELTEDVALVLFDALTREKREDGQRSLVLEHPAERNARWMLEAQLEKGLVAPFRADDREALAAARARLEAAGGSW